MHRLDDSLIHNDQSFLASNHYINDDSKHSERQLAETSI